ncbi:RNA polymerase sigma factor [Gemmiger formicilis]
MWELTNKEFTGLMQQYQKLIYTVCLQFVHEPHTAEDLTQDTFLSAFSAIDRCEPQYYKQWLVRVAANKCKDHLKSAWVRKVDAPGDDALPEPRGAPGSDADDPAQSVADRAGAAELETLVRGLREPYGKIAVLYFLEHRETAEIAKLVGRPPATVKQPAVARKAAASPADHREEAEGMSLYFDNNKLFDAEGHLTDEGLYAIKDGTLDDLGALEAAEHLSFCDYCLLRYTAMIDAAPDCMKQPMRDLIPQVQSLMRLRSFRIMTNRYVSAAAAVVLGFVMWGAVSTFGVPNAAALLPQQPAARQERFGTKFNTAVNGFYKSLDDTFKSFTLTAENGLDQIRAQSIGGSTAKGE